jgi:MFS family permease
MTWTDFKTFFQSFKKYDHRLWILALGWIASAVGFSLVFPFLALYFHSELGISMTKIGLFLTVSACIRALFQVFGGELSDRVGRYYQMAGAQFIRTIVFVALAYSVYSGWSFYGIGALVIVNSVFGALFQPAANAAVADIVTPEQRTEAYSITRVAGNLGWAIGPAVGGFLAAKSYDIMFLFAGGMTLISSSIIAVFLRGIKYHIRPQESFKLKEIFSYSVNQLIFKHAALMLLLYLVVSQLITPLSLYTVDFMGITKEQLGLLFSLNGLMVVLLQIPTTRMLRPIRLTIQMVLGSIIYAAGYLMVGLVSTYVLFIVSTIVITTGEIFVSPPALSITANLAPPGRTGRYMGIYGFAVTIGWSFGPAVGGTLLDIAKPHFIYSWSVISFLAIISAIGFGWLTRQIPPELNRQKEY